MNAARSTKWSNFSFRKQLFLILTSFSAIITVAIISFLIINERSAHRQELLHEGQLLASVLTKELQLPLYAGNNEEVAEVVANMFAYKSIAAVTVRDDHGQLVADSRQATATPEAKPLKVKSWRDENRTN